ncbi:MAG: hypothetical protein M4D80_12810 [Myxococcota bacterium]|nr:hypothetical protein [Myxococcota bacterium]
MRDATIAAAIDAAPIDAAPIDAAAEPAPLTYASLDDFLSLAGTGPSNRLGGYELGQPADVPYRRITITSWGDAGTHAIVRDGKVAHVVVELAPDGNDVEAMSAKIADATTRIERRWGAPRKGERARWRGAAAQLFVIEYDGFLRGTPSLVVDLLPLGDEHVCGARDGFAAFFAKFRKAIVAGDKTALATMIVNDPDSDRITDNLPRVSSLPAKPGCHLSREVYYWRTIEKMHGGAYWEFARRGKTWVAQGPFFIGHDDDPNVSAP